MINIDLFSTRIIFSSRPESIPSDLRPIWKICVVVLMLELASISKKASLSKIHVLNWALQSSKNQVNLLSIINGEDTPDFISVRIEPSLNRALNFAHGEGLLDFVNGKNIQLTTKGQLIASEILKNDSLFSDEKLFLKKIGKHNLTEQFVNSLFSEG